MELYTEYLPPHLLIFELQQKVLDNIGPKLFSLIKIIHFNSNWILI